MIITEVVPDASSDLAIVIADVCRSHAKGEYGLQSVPQRLCKIHSKARCEAPQTVAQADRGTRSLNAATSSDAKLWMRTADITTRQELYDKHLRHIPNQIVNVLYRKPILDVQEKLGAEEMLESYKLPKLHQVLFCLHCGTSEIASPHCSHSCDAPLIGRRISEPIIGIDSRGDSIVVYDEWVSEFRVLAKCITLAKATNSYYWVWGNS